MKSKKRKINRVNIKPRTECGLKIVRALASIQEAMSGADDDELQDVRLLLECGIIDPYLKEDNAYIEGFDGAFSLTSTDIAQTLLECYDVPELD
jgi:hypothetical protein